MDNQDHDKRFNAEQLNIIARFKLVKVANGKTRLLRVDDDPITEPNRRGVGEPRERR